MSEISKLIINGPYEEPGKYWKYKRETREFELIDGKGRRPAGYLKATPNAKGFDDPGQFVPIEQVNEIRKQVDAWRKDDYPSITIVTKKLLEHWQDTEQREQRFFFCQLEAIETLIWLVETPEGAEFRKSIDGDGGDFERLCSKMATGTGKTIVMAMIIAWNFINKAANPKDPRFSRYALVVAPGLTVKERLRVLLPQEKENYYTAFDIVPKSMMERMRQGKVLIHNWHTLAWDSQKKLDAKVEKGSLRSVDKRKRYEISDEKYLQQVLGHDMAEADDLLVINDEAHHAWRVNPNAKRKYKRIGADKNNVEEEATIWIGGLDRIHKARRILCCFDLSATPFMPSGDKSAEENLFQWIVSDFGLNDAIESGLVKTPKAVISDNSKLDENYRSRLYHIYMQESVKDELNRKNSADDPLPDLVRNAYMILGEHWKKTRTAWKKAGQQTPPVMITVANITETSARINRAFANKNIEVPDDLCSDTGLLQIDSKALKQAEALDKETDLSEGSATNKEQRAEWLRQKVGTVGVPKAPGEKVCNVISVGMLSEGWDAKNVTHIMGLRAFSSQLLCEQVVGRGLRRVSYDVGEDGLFEPEYVNIIGVPFTFLPQEESGTTPPPPKPTTRIEPRLEKQQHAIKWPNVVRIDYTYKPRLRLDWDEVEPLPVHSYEYITKVELKAIVSGKPHNFVREDISLEYAQQGARLQTIAFKIAKMVYERRNGYDEWKGDAYEFLAQIVPLIMRFIESDRIIMESDSLEENERQVIITLKMNDIVQHIWEAVRIDTADTSALVLDQEFPILSTGDMRPWHTSKPCEAAEKSHISHCVFDSRWEASEAYALEQSAAVESFAKNDHLGFAVSYIHNGRIHKYYPDFLIRMASGDYLVLEVKGENTDKDKTKRKYLQEWCQAVNEHGGFGRWHSAVSFNPVDLAGILSNHNAKAAA